VSPTKKYAKSVVPVTKTDRGFEARGVIDDLGSQSLSRRSNRESSPGEHRPYEPNTYTKGRSAESGSADRTTDRSSYGTDNRRSNGKTESSGTTRQSQPKSYEGRRTAEPKRGTAVPSAGRMHRRRSGLNRRSRSVRLNRPRMATNSRRRPRPAVVNRAATPSPSRLRPRAVPTAVSGNEVAD